MTVIAVLAAKRTILVVMTLVSIYVDSVVDRSGWSRWCRRRLRRSGRLRIGVGRRTSSCEGKVLKAILGIDSAACT
jgi:hypothetical protein